MRGDEAVARVAQDHFEAILFNVMRTRGFDDAHVRRYKMVTQFFQQRRPLIVLICGVPCTGACPEEPKFSTLKP
jgi:2-phosphoglycerate kinase